MREKEKERGKVSGFRVISPSQHRPLNSTPLVETKSDTRKAKLLQMHKPFYSPPIYPLPPVPLLSPSSSYPFFASRSLQSPERPLRFPPPLSTLAPFSYPLILSQPFSLRKCRSAIHLSSSSSSLPSYPSFSFPFHFLCFFCYLFLSIFLLFMYRSRTFHFLVLFFSPFLYIRETSRSRFLFYHSIPDRASPVARSFSKSDCSTSDYLTLLINSRYKSLRFSLFHGTRPPLEARKIK